MPEVVAERTETLSAAAPAEVGRIDFGAVVRLGLVALQLLLLLLVVSNFRLAPSAMWTVLKFAAVGFVVHAFAPMRYRLPLFIGLSLASVVLVFGWSAGLPLIGISLGLIAICHLPVAWGVRVGLLVAVGAALTMVRGGWLSMPVSQAIWPILGSMFMFRLIVYMYDVRHEPKLQSWSGALAYFFMLPNVVFPFFPVVDYKTFRRTHYDGESSRLYQTGVAWMVRGVVQLILYRFVYYYLTIAPEDVQTSSQLVRFVIANYALYLRVSGTFHLIVGMLHLFGFNLPLSNNLYFLAGSFTDYWRRVNIYWKDFMMKVFYYPSYFWMRRLGPTTALVLATVVVFVATTVLHSYQWFWLRGDWYMSPMDVAFWSALGVLVIGNVVWEAKRGRKRTLGKAKWSVKDTAGRMLRTLLTFTILSSLWSLWSAPSIEEWFGIWSVWNVGAPFSATTTALIVVTVAGLFLGSWFLATTRSGQAFTAFSQKARLRESPYVVLGTLVALLALGDARVRERFDSTLLLVVEDLQHERLNRADQEQLERGYYENLLGVEQTNPELAELYRDQGSDWVSLWRTPAIANTGDIRRVELVPSVAMTYKGAAFSTNRYGMRDRQRELVGDPGVYRFGVLGASTAMGSGVSDEEPFPLLVERRWLAEHPDQPIEMLNFAVESYNAVEQVGVADRRLGQFEMDALLYIAHETEFEKTVNSLSNMVEGRIDLEYDALRGIVARAGIEPGLPNTIALRELGREREDIVRWAYRHIVEEARSRGVTPIWAFIPMPVPGTGPCPPGSAELFCFGNTARPGAAADASDPRVARLFELAREAGFITLDLSQIYGETDLQSLWIAATDGHPNAAGHRMIADGLYAALRGEPAITQDISDLSRSTN